MHGDAEIFIQTNEWGDRLAKEIPRLSAIIDEQRGKGQLRVLDLGCGTGQHLQVLASMYPEHAFFGLDIDAARIAIALEQAELEGLPITYVVGDFPEYRRQVPDIGDRFDMIYAIGNSLALMWGCGSPGAVIERVAGMLESGGFFFFQIQNNEKPKRGYTTSKVITLENGDEVFTSKRYQPDDGLDAMLVEFLTFKRSPGDQKYSVKIDTYSWRLIAFEEIQGLLQHYGFGRVTAWSDYATSPFDPATSDDLVVLAKKKLDAQVLCDGKGMRLPARK
ncbi:MAG TPA: class I SAM-dependent methyltransferase [Candidatus Lokiarchaeia archaeon]|nr:class I SAM-dependent methyltransferase [Candidatus Lokiarchaeia archaeon]